MATNLAIDPELLEKALEVSGLKTKKATVNLALQEFINRRKQIEILDLFGKMDPDSNYDYKKGRTR
jgi:Arc/MetJ family transcription regulator